MLYAIVSDIHSNYTALKAVQDAIRQLRTEVTYWFLGDVVGYGPTSDAVACVQWLKRQDDDAAEQGQQPRWVPGNHDAYLVQPDGDFGIKARETLKRHSEALMAEENQSVGAWFLDAVRSSIAKAGSGDDAENRSLVFEKHDGLTLAFTHASVRPLERRSTYLYPWQHTIIEGDLVTLQEKLIAEQGLTETASLFFGHTHLPYFGRLMNGRIQVESIKYSRPISLGPGIIAINPGSVGQPRDGDTRASFVLLDTEQATIEFRRVDYDRAGVSARLRLEGNSDDYKIREMYEKLAQIVEGKDLSNEMASYKAVYQTPEFDLIAQSAGQIN